jgi:hypothetical protein
MIRRRSRCLWAFLVLPFLAGWAALTWGQTPSAAELFPVRRIAIPLERVPAELQRLGVLVQLPRADFEAKLRQAAQAHEAGQRQPRLVKAVYTAEVSGPWLTGGSGHWTVHHAGAASAILPVPQFNLALSKIKVGNADAVLGEFDGKSLGLWIEQPGSHAVYFDWSARGQAFAGGVAFDLRLPSCPVTMLEFKLPADHTLVLGKNVGMLTGPLEAEQPSQKLWRIQVTGRTQIDFVVRKGNEPTASRLVLATVENRQELGPGSALVDFDVHIEAVQHALSELVFNYDRALEPYEVTLRQAELKSWHIAADSAGSQAKPASIVVQLREPKQGAFQARIRCLAARAASQEWIAPGLQLRSAIPRGETLHVHLPAAQPLDRCDAGSFRLLTATTGKEDARTLTLVDLDPEASAPRRPRFLLSAPASEVHARQQTRWSITPTGMTLAAEMTCEARRGQRFQLGVKLPPAPWRVDDVTWEPKDALRSWTTAGSMLVVELRRALETRSPGKLTLRLRAPLDGAATGARFLSIPELMPLDAAQRQATYAIHVDPSLQASLAKASAPLTLPDAKLFGHDGLPWFYFVVRDQPLTGVLRLHGPRAGVDVRVQQSATLAAAQGTLETRLDVEPVLGQPKHIDLWLSASMQAPWTVSGEGQALPRLERRFGAEIGGPLLLLGARHGGECLATAAIMPRGESWRLVWQEPLAKKTTLLLRGPLGPVPGQLSPLPAPLPGWLWPALLPVAELRPEGRLRHWHVPVVTVADAEHGEGEIVLQPNGLDLVRAAWQDLQPQGAGATASARVYRWSGPGARPALSVATVPNIAASDVGAIFDQARLVTYFETGRPCLHHYRFHVVQWTHKELPLLLPPPARQVVAARLDGRWLDRLVHSAHAEGIEVRLPMPLDGAGHWFDVVYACEAPGDWFAGSEVLAAPPRLPATPWRERQLWRLAPGVVPLHQERLASLHHGLGSPALWLRQLWQGADPLFEGGAAADDWIEPQRHSLLGAEAAVRRRGRRDATLGEALQRLVLDELKEQTALILDREALRQLGLEPATSVSPGLAAGSARPFWEALGLVYVPARAAPLLTSRQRWHDWRQGQALPERLNEALAETVAHGQDASGQFCRADVWLRTEPADRAEHGPRPALLSDWFVHGWTEWEPLPGQDPMGALRVIQASALRVLGLLVGGVGLMLVVFIRRRLTAANRVRLTILLLVPTIFTLFSVPLALVELAFWPSVALLVLLVVDYPRLLFRSAAPASPVQPSGRRQTSLTVSCVLLTLLSGAWFTWAQPEPVDLFTVYYVDAGADRAVALVRPELLKRLDDWQQRAAQPVQGTVLVGASYQGKWHNAAGDLRAQFDLFSFSEQAILHVPLGGIELKEGAFLDGAPVYPSAAPGKMGFLVPVRGKGWHRLTLAFRVPYQAVGEFQDLRWMIPALTINQFDWQAPANLNNLQIPRTAGEVKTVLDAAKTTQTLQAKLGRESQIHVRWRAPSTIPVVAEHEVHEHYFWNLDPAAPALSAVLAYTPAAGALARVEVALPDATDVRGVEVVSAGQGVLLGKWQVANAGGQRILMIDLAAPATGPFQVHVHMIPRGGLGSGKVALGLPMPRHAKPTEGVLAYRLEGFDITDKTKNLGVTGLTPETFAGVWSRSGARDVATPTRAYSFRRAAPSASLELALQPVKPHVRLDLDWQVQPAGAELRALAEWTSPQDLLAVELLLPTGLEYLDVRGSQLHHWSVHENSLQVWLDKPSKQVALTVQVWLPRPLQNQPFMLPVVRVPQADASATTITLRPGEGWTLITERLLHLTRLADGPEARFQATQPAYEGAFTMRPAAIAPQFHVLTSAEPRGHQVTVTASVLGWLAQGDFPVLRLHLRNWQGETPHLEASVPAVRQEYRQVGEDHSWSFQLPPGSARVVTMKIRAQIDSAKPFALPRLEIDGGKVVEQQVTWATGALAPQELRGLKEAKAGPSGSRHGLVAALAPRRPANLWQVDDPHWRCVLAATTPQRTRPGEILFAEQQALPGGRGRWRHQADWLLRAHDLRELRVLLPQGAVPLAASVDGAVIVPRSVAPAAFEIPLPAYAGLFQVRLRWRYPEAQEDVNHPLLAAPSLPDVETVAIQGALYLPAGLQLGPGMEGFSSRETWQLIALARASTVAAAAFANREPSEANTINPLAWHARFLEASRHLEYQARLAGDPDALAVLATLRKEHALAAQRGEWEVAKGPDPGDPAWVVARSDEGAPVFWQGAAPQAVRLETVPGSASVPGWTRETLVVAIMGVFLLSWLPRGLKWFAGMWPEQLAGLALLGWALWGESLVGFVLLAVAAAGRLVSASAWLGRHLVTWWYSAPPEAAA